MAYDETDNMWMVCLNCEMEFSLDDVFASELNGEIECPICSGHSFRKTNSDSSQEDYYLSENW